MTQARVPALVADYFGGEFHGGRHPVIEQAFSPSTGWRRYPIAKRVCTSWLRKMKAQGVTGVGLRCGDRLADFTVDEILRHERRLAQRPLLGGALIGSRA